MDCRSAVLSPSCFSDSRGPPVEKRLENRQHLAGYGPTTQSVVSSNDRSDRQTPRRQAAILQHDDLVDERTSTLAVDSSRLTVAVTARVRLNGLRVAQPRVIRAESPLCAKGSPLCRPR